MAWFGRRRDDAPVEEPQPVAEQAGGLDDEAALQTVVARIGPAEQERITAAVAAVEAEGVDVDDVESIGAGLDRAHLAWRAAPEQRAPGPRCRRRALRPRHR